MSERPRSIGLDVHRDNVMIAGIDGQQQIILEPCKVSLPRFSEWSAQHLLTTDQVALEATSNAWAIYDQLTSRVDEIKVANVYKVKLISSSRAKTDRHDAVVLAKLLAANLLSAVWVPPVEVRELRIASGLSGIERQPRTACTASFIAIIYSYPQEIPLVKPIRPGGRHCPSPARSNCRSGMNWFIVNIYPPC
ncbi:MAG: transposase [Chloroflexota bacterium]|jgi:hypothetical protein